MSALIAALLLLSQSATLNLDQIRAESNLDRRAKLAIEFAGSAERSAEAAYGRGEMKSVDAELKSMLEGVELARKSLQQTGKSARSHVGPYKSAELKTEEILKRLADLQRRMDADERAMVEGPKGRVQEIHDEWFDGIMSKKK